jgi:hypothetical protein
MRTAVLGCGPSGLVAAHAASCLGDEVIIFSKNRKSQMFGAQYLHEPIPGISSDKTTVHYTLRGTVEQYRRKVYGESYDGTVSPEDLPVEHDAWDIRDAYDELWERYHGLIRETEITRHWIDAFAQSGAADRIISSVPLHVLCQYPTEHQFNAIRIWAAGEAPEIGKIFPRHKGDLYLNEEEILKPSTVICNGTPDPFWYRASLIFGRATFEWPWDPGFFLPEEDGSLVMKPINNTFDCWPNVLRVGRYGTWTKGVLVHQAFGDVSKWITSQS